MHANGRTKRFRPVSGAAAWRPTVRAGGRLGLLRAVAAVRVRPANPPGSRWEAWAQRLAARHGAAHTRWSWVARVLARPRLVLRTTIQPMRWAASLTIHSAPLVTSHRPQIRIGSVAASLVSPRRGPVAIRAATAAVPYRVLQMTQRSEPANERRAVVTDVHERRAVMTHIHERNARTVNRESEIVERLLARRERRETQLLASVATAGHALPLVGLLAAPAAVVARGRPAAKPKPMSMPLRGVAPAVADSGAPARTPLAAIDIQTLADQVVQTIDQRVIAARERLGTR